MPKVSNSTAAIVAKALRGSRPWIHNEEYQKHNALRDAGYYCNLSWELAAAQIGDDLLKASGYTFNRNQFMRDAGAYSYTCQRCYEQKIVHVAECTCMPLKVA